MQAEDTLGNVRPSESDALRYVIERTAANGNGHLTTFAYDALNRLVSESDPLGNTTSYGYDAVGNRVSLLDAAGFITTFSYDAANRLVGIDYPEPDVDVSFTFDAAGNRNAMQDGAGVTTWVYDDLHRPTAISDPFGGTVGYAYDASGNRTQLAYPDGKSVGYAYDPGNRLVQVTDWASMVTAYTYDGANRLSTVSLPNSVTSTYSYDAAGRALEIRHESPIELLSSFVYTYDDVGNRVQAVETLRLPAEPGADLFFDDGESGGGQWIAEGSWALAGEAAHSGSFAWSDSPGADYLNGSNDSLTMAEPVELPASPAARLVFWDPIDLGNGDHAYVEISADDGATWTVLLDQFEVVNPEWTEHSIDLSASAGQSILIRFRLDARVGSGVGDGWHLDDVRITTEPAPQLAQLSDFVVLGAEGVYLKQNATVVSGDVGANLASDGPYLAEGSEATVGIGVDFLDPDSRVLGDSVYLKDNAAVYDVYYNELDGLGDVLGEGHTPVALPLVAAFPDLPAFNPGTEDFDVPQGGALTLEPGSYGLLKARLNSTVTFTGGVYEFAEWDVGESVDLVFQAPSEIRIVGKLAVDQNSTMLPSDPEMDATDIVIYVNGINGGTGNLGATPKAAKFGIGTIVQANVYVPNGTLWLRQNGQFTGAFLGKWVTLGIGATATHLSQWSEGSTASVLGAGASLASLPPSGQLASAINLQSSFPPAASANSGYPSALGIPGLSTGLDSGTISLAGSPIHDASLPASRAARRIATGAIFEPTLALMAPIALVAVVPFARRRRPHELSLGLLLLVILAGTGLAVAALAVPGSTAEAMTLSAPAQFPASAYSPLQSPTRAPAFTPFQASALQQGGLQTTTIDYAHDPLYRLTAADYSSGEFFHYTYDAVGNRLTQDTLAGTNTYTYDIANRLTSVDGVTFTWDSKGNLLDDGTRTYGYDHANRLTTIVMGADTFTYSYNGLGDRLQQTINGAPQNYTLDLAAGLTQVLQEGTSSYLYGVGRIGEEQPSKSTYHISDAIGSVRQLANFSGTTMSVSTFEPFGSVLRRSGSSTSAYAFAGEQFDSSIQLAHLRYRVYSPASGRFLTRDLWRGDYDNPLSLNAWNYVEGNPVNFTDPSGRICLDPWAPSGVHLDPSRGCDYPPGSTGSLWWRRDTLGPDTAIIDVPWVDEQSEEMWNRYPNSCGAAALYMYLRGEGVDVALETLVQQLRNERPGGYDGYCCRTRISNARGESLLPAPTPDPLGWCNEACVSAETLAEVARKYYGLNVISGDNWTHSDVYEKVGAGHPVLALIRSELTRTYFGHFVVVRGFVDQGWTVVFNDSYPGEEYWDVRGGSSSIRRQVGERRTADWSVFDRSWASSVDEMDPLSPGGHVRWAMAVR